MRDSPFPKHRLHLKSYLGGERARAIAATAARAGGMSTEQLLARVGALPEMQISVPRHLDRARWSGTDDVVVLGTTLSVAEMVSAGQLTGYNIRGEAVPVPIGMRQPFPFIAIVPAETAFGRDPEATRKAAPRRPRQHDQHPRGGDRDHVGGRRGLHRRP